MDLDGYNVTFVRDAFFGFWRWEAETPGGESLSGPLFGLCALKENAEKDAARRIRMHAERETVNGTALLARVAG